jgi:phosphatidyl-myo-inositol alpha-mannosyltransferase
VSAPLAIAIVCPTAWPPGDDIAWRVRAEADALARRGHRVTIFAPATRANGLGPDTAPLQRAGTGGPDAVRAEPGRVRTLIVGRARKSGSRLGVSPFDTASLLEGAISDGAFDVVHVHEPLTPTPGVSVLRRAGGATAATFHRRDPMTGAAFMGPLVTKAMARVDIRIATSPTVERSVRQILGGSFLTVPWAADGDPADPPDAGVAIVARGRDRAGLRFALAVARLLPPGSGPVAVMGPREAPWRTRTAVPKALRDRVTIVADTGPESWRALLADAAVVLLGTPADIDGPVAAQALASGRAVIAPRSVESADLLTEGSDAITPPPFSRAPWTDAVAGLLDDAGTRRALGAAARAATRSWDQVAAELETAYRDALARHERGTAPTEGRVVADLRIRPSDGQDPGRLAADCWEAGLDVIAVAAPGGVAPAAAVAAAAPAELTVILGQEIESAEGVVVGLFLRDDVPDGLPFAETAERIHAQGGVVVIPNPATSRIPAPEVLREHATAVDCRELLTGAGGPAQRAVVRNARELGVVVSAGSGAGGPDLLGTVGIAMRPFRDGRDFIDALADGEPVRPRRRRARRARGGRRAS